MAGAQHRPEKDQFWLCNSGDHNRYDTHDYCLVHDVEIPTDQPCPETLRRLAQVWDQGWWAHMEHAIAVSVWNATEGAETSEALNACNPYGCSIPMCHAPRTVQPIQYLSVSLSPRGMGTVAHVDAATTPSCSIPYNHGPHTVDNGRLQVECPGRGAS